MTSAPAQGFGVNPEIIIETELENSTRIAKDISLMDENNLLLNNLIKQIELVTNEENISGDDNVNGSN